MKFTKISRKRELTVKCTECDSIYSLKIRMSMIKVDYCNHIHCFDCGSPIYFYLTDDNVEESRKD